MLAFSHLAFSARSLSESPLLAFYGLLNLPQLGSPSPLRLFSQRPLRTSELPNPGVISQSLSQLTSRWHLAPCASLLLELPTPLASKTQPVPASAQPIHIFLFVLHQGLLSPYPLFKCWCVSSFCLLISCVTSDELPRFCPPGFLHK